MFLSVSGANLDLRQGTGAARLVRHFAAVVTRQAGDGVISSFLPTCCGTMFSCDALLFLYVGISTAKRFLTNPVEVERRFTKQALSQFARKCLMCTLS